LKLGQHFNQDSALKNGLTPYTDKTLEKLPGEGIKNLLVICPGFASDCVETLEEIDIQGRESFLTMVVKILI
jgi:ferrochelatase